MATENTPYPDEAQAAINNILTGSGEAAATPALSVNNEQPSTEAATVENTPSQETTPLQGPELGTDFAEGSAAKGIVSGVTPLTHGPESTENVTFSGPTQAAERSTSAASPSAETTQAPQSPEALPETA